MTKAEETLKKSKKQYPNKKDIRVRYLGRKPAGGLRNLH